METENKTTVESQLTTEKSNTAVIAYLTVIGLIIAFVMNNDKKEPFASYHIRQSLGLMITGLALSLINIIPVLGWVVSIVGFFIILYMWIMGLLNAINGREKPMPILGKKYAEWFKTIQ